MKSHPFFEVAHTANEQVLKGNDIHQKFQCENCGVEQHMEQPNAFYVKGKCEECGFITDIMQKGCNFLLVIKDANNVVDCLESIIKS